MKQEQRRWLKVQSRGEMKTYRDKLFPLIKDFSYFCRT